MNYLMTTLVLVLLSFSTGVNAQGPGRGWGPGQCTGMGPGAGPGGGECRIPGLTEEQRASIEVLRSAHFKKVRLIRAEIAEKEARMNTLRLAEDPDYKAIDRAIEDISKLKGDIMKEREAHHRAINELLTDEQKRFSDSRKDFRKKRGEGNRKGGRGFGRGNCGQCPYR